MITSIRYQSCEQLLIGDYPKVSSDSLNWPWAVLLTRTHVIALFYDYDFNVSPEKELTFIQAFTAPTDSRLVRNGAGVLRLSHEGVIPGNFSNVNLIRNSIVDPISGTTSIRLLHQVCMDHNLDVSCIDVTLHRLSSTDGVLPMTIDLHDIAHLKDVCNGSGAECYVGSSDDGRARGFWRFEVPYLTPNPIRPVMRFTIDASQDRCVTVLGKILNPQWKQIGDPRCGTNILFDGVRGRFYSHPGWSIVNIE